MAQASDLQAKLLPSYLAIVKTIKEEIPNTDQSVQQNLKEQSRDSMVLEPYYRNAEERFFYFVPNIHPRGVDVRK